MRTVEEINLKELIEVETLEGFNRNGYVKCCFHSEKTPSLKVKFDSNSNKYKFKCFGCGATGDAIDFIIKYKNLDYIKAREYLGIDVEKTPIELEEEKVKEYIEWQIKNIKKGYKILGIFRFANERNETLYYKVKLLKPDGKKETPYYHIENGKIINTRGTNEEAPYNLYRALEGIKSDKVIIILEGEKDVNTVNYLLKNRDYVATSVKNCKDLSVFENARIYVIGDTGEAGEKYVNNIKYKLIKNAIEFKIINLPGIKALGDNKDVTDWIEAGHTKEDLLDAFNRSLDLKSRYEIQQDSKGIYKTLIKEVDGEETYRRFYLTDFQLIEANRINIVDEDREGVRLVLKSITGKTYERIGRAAVFDDLKTFKNFLGTLDLNFLAKGESLTEFGSWINRFWAIENEEIHTGVKFLPVKEKLHLITPTGAIGPERVNLSIKSDMTNSISVIDKDLITKDELIDVYKHVFKFIGKEKALTIIGTVINNLAAYQAKESKVKLHHLLIVGESGSGKSTILSNVIAPILNYPVQDIKSVGLITPFAMTKDLSTGNYTSLYDEFKPSSLDRFKIQKISETLRNLYDRTSVMRGDKTFKVKEFQLNRPIILAGEESYPNSEKALIERSAIVYVSKSERTEKNTEAMKWLLENEVLLNKFGRSLINTVLNLTPQAYMDIRECVQGKFNSVKNRVLTTAINVATGIEIFNKLLKSLELGDKILTNYEEFIEKNIQEEILDNGNEISSTVEQMLKLFDDMIGNNRVRYIENLIQYKDDKLYIKTTEMINQIHLFVKNVGSAEVVPLKFRDFKTQASKAGYIFKDGSKQLNVFDKISEKNIRSRFDQYSLSKIRELDCSNILEVIDVQEGLEPSDVDDNVVQGYFGN